MAVNEAGEDSIQYDVRVLCESEYCSLWYRTHCDKRNNLWICISSSILTVPPVIRGTDSDFPEEITVLVGKTTQLECYVDGNPTPKITWFKDKHPISSNGSHRIVSNGRTLQVKIWINRYLFANHKV